MNNKKYIVIIIFILLIVSCEPRIIDLNDDPMPNNLKDTKWVKSVYTSQYGDLVLREDYRTFQSSTSKYITETIYDFNNASYTDATVIKTYSATFNVDAKPNRMKAVLEKISLNGVDVTGKDDVEIGATTRNFEDKGTSIYYIFDIDYTDDNLDSLLIAGDYDLYPDYIAINQQAYTKIYDDTITSVPTNFAPATWKRAMFIDKIKDTIFDEPFIEIKQRKFTGVITGSHLYVKMTYHFKSFSTEIYVYDFLLTFDPIPSVTTAEAVLVSVYKGATDITGSTTNTLANKTFPIPNAGFIINLIIEHYDDVIRYTDMEGSNIPDSFDNVVYSLSDDF